MDVTRAIMYYILGHHMPTFPEIISQASKEYISSRAQYDGPAMHAFTNIMKLLARSVFSSRGFQWSEYNKSQFEKLACEDQSYRGLAAFCMNEQVDGPADCFQTLIIGNAEGHYPLEISTGHTFQQPTLKLVLCHLTPFGDSGVK